MNAPEPIAADLGLIRCDVCALVLRAPVVDAAARCPRCGHVLHTVKPLSVQRTLAWLTAALALYLPANLLPVMTTSSVLGRESHTIGGGIVELWSTGSHELALIVFIASIVVPLVKMVALTLLLATARRRSRWRQRERAALARLVAGVGHWSMLDVYVVVLLTAMVSFGVLAGVEPEPGLVAFGAVVVFTMLAAESFDPRWIWPDEGEGGDG